MISFKINLNIHYCHSVSYSTNHKPLFDFSFVHQQLIVHSMLCVFFLFSNRCFCQCIVALSSCLFIMDLLSAWHKNHNGKAMDNKERLSKDITTTKSSLLGSNSSIWQLLNSFFYNLTGSDFFSFSLANIFPLIWNFFQICFSEFRILICTF